MAKIETRRADVIWNYVGTVVSMASGFALLPLLMRHLTAEELGLWYVYVAIANLTTLFEFGFNPTFARNIVYVVSGARRLTEEGCDADSVGEGVDWHLLNVVIRASKLLYAVMALVTLALLATAGTAYVARVASGLEPSVVWPSWGLFCASSVLNLYFMYSVTVLRGYGDVEGENRARTFARVVQLVVSGTLLATGSGLLGASVGYLANAVLMRAFAMARMRKHREIEEGRRSDSSSVRMSEVMGTLATVSHVAWRDGVVQLALYASTQAMSIMSSLWLGLAETGTYSVLLQLASAVQRFAGAYPSAFYPGMQASVADGDGERQREIVSTGVVAYWALFALGTAGVCLVVLPLLPLVRPGASSDYALFFALCLYLGLLNQHSVFCNYIICMNEIPYMPGYLIAAVAGILLVWLLAGRMGLGAWGIVAGQALSQLAYNNWKWPTYLCSRLGFRYREALAGGVQIWRGRLRHAAGRRG